LKLKPPDRCAARDRPMPGLPNTGLMSCGSGGCP